MKPITNKLGKAFLSIIGIFLTFQSHAVTTESYQTVPLDGLELERIAVRLTPSQSKKLHNFQMGFIWDKQDNRTRSWRPQGITEFSSSGKSFIAVSWYDTSKDKESNRGVKIAFVDYSNMESIKYTHVLLVDQDLEPLRGMHAGGLHYLEGKLYVPDTRKGKNTIRVFPIDSFKVAPQEGRSRHSELSYFLVQASSHAVDKAPSFLSYDWSQERFLTGTFDKKCRQSLLWYDSAQDTKELAGPFYKKMQGAASEEGHLWISTSFNRYRKSHLYHGAYTPGEVPDLTIFKKTTYPPGLEDLHLSPSSDHLWMLTEFGSREGFFNNRMVFSINK